MSRGQKEGKTRCTNANKSESLFLPLFVAASSFLFLSFSTFLSTSFFCFSCKGKKKDERDFGLCFFLAGGGGGGVGAGTMNVATGVGTHVFLQ